MIKRVWNILLLMLFCCIATLHADEVKVTMKSGTTITGELKELVATDHVTIIIAGVESVISMDDVSSIEKVSTDQTTRGNKPPKLQYGQYQITDTKEYPDSFIIKIGNQELTMILIRGGWFNMGYDDRHSLAWNTEPVHKVNLSSYYICKHFISYSDAHAIINVKESNGSPYPFVLKKDVDSFVDKLVKELGIPLRMPTEAEWEYASLMPFANNIFLFGNCYEWCSDYWGDFTEEEQTNPQGPIKGKTCVFRCFSNDNRKWRRTRSTNPSMSSQSDLRGFLRLAISADQVVNL